MLKTVPGTSSAYAERVIGGYYLDIAAEPRRTRPLRPDGRATCRKPSRRRLAARRSPPPSKAASATRVNVRYPRDLRSDPRSIASDVLIALPNGGTVPLGEVASVTLGRGPTTIRTENGQLAAYIFVDIRDRDLGGYVAEAQEGRRRERAISARLLRHLERPVRISGARRRRD